MVLVALLIGRCASGRSFSGKRVALAAVNSSRIRSSAPLALRLAPPQYSQDRTPVRGWRDLSCTSPVAGRQRVVPSMAKCPKRVIADGQYVVIAAPISTLIMKNIHLAAPRPRLERGTYCLGGTFEVWPGGAGCGLRCQSATAGMAGCGLAWPSACSRWLPVRLPGISLPDLTASDRTRRQSPDFVQP